MSGPLIQRWRMKFAAAIAGCRWAVTTQNSFYIHIVIAAVVIALAAVLQLSSTQWGMLVVAITGVMVAEMFNTAIECLAHAVHPARHPVIGRALDTAAGAVLIAAIGAGVIGFLVLGPPLWNWGMQQFLSPI